MNDIIVKPLETYEPPNVPTLAESRKNPDFLKKLPLRWRQKAAVLAAAGLLGAWAFSGCAEQTPETANPEPADNDENYNSENNDNQGGDDVSVIDYTTDPPTVTITTKPAETTEPNVITTTTAPEIVTILPEIIETPPVITTTAATTTATPPVITNPVINTPDTDNDLLFRMHTGGSGGVYYIVHFTEQEALGIIRSQLEAAGLNLGCALPDYTVEIEKMDEFRMMPYTIGADLSLYDSIRNVAIALGSWRNTQEIVEEFEKQNSDIAFGAFRVPNTDSHISAWDYDWYEDENGNWLREEPSGEIIAADKARARPILEAELNNQIQKFIEHLKAEGII
jgi:hypothetical protein